MRKSRAWPRHSASPPFRPSANHAQPAHNGWLIRVLKVWRDVMVDKSRPQVIAIEEHYWDRELVSHFNGGDVLRVPELEKRLYDLGELRLKEMDEAGVDYQVISHGA